ncbi:hypothetical protein MRX96_036664 [Rhipicephalus microplus]
MHEATTYDEYMLALRRVVERHMVPDRQSTRALESPWRQQNSHQLRDADTNQPVAHVRQHLTRYISGLLGSTGNDGDRDASVAATLHPALSERQEKEEPRWAVSSVTVIRALARMSTRTATGPDEVPARLVKCLRPQAREKLADQLSSILSGAEIPKDWRQAYDGELVSVVCRACGGADETIAHIVTECPQLSARN